MQSTELTSLATLRLLVGFLGEKDHFAWWQSSFFAPGSNAFLAPVFPRTQLLAQYEGVTRAASLQHDDRIGVGDVCHLFRLPEDVEQGLHRPHGNGAAAPAPQAWAPRELSPQIGSFPRPRL